MAISKEEAADYALYIHLLQPSPAGEASSSSGAPARPARSPTLPNPEDNVETVVHKMSPADTISKYNMDLLVSLEQMQLLPFLLVFE